MGLLFLTTWYVLLEVHNSSLFHLSIESVHGGEDVERFLN